MAPYHSFYHVSWWHTCYIVRHFPIISPIHRFQDPFQQSWEDIVSPIYRSYLTWLVTDKAGEPGVEYRLVSQPLSYP